MPNPDPTDWEDALIADLRANGGRPSGGPLKGHPLLLMTSQGARSGQPRRAILTWSRDGEDYIVAGTANGADVDPAWVNNVRVNPEVELEVANRTFPARAEIVDEADRQRLWDAHVEALPWFGAYPSQTDRVIPVIRLTSAT
jgi:deazaflavin-dependent oxidoreductase (nitroreductase family)